MPYLYFIVKGVCYTAYVLFRVLPMRPTSERSIAMFYFPQKAKLSDVLLIVTIANRKSIVASDMYLRSTVASDMS